MPVRCLALGEHASEVLAKTPCCQQADIWDNNVAVMSFSVVLVQVRDKLVAACHRSGVAVQYGKRLQGLTPAGGNGSPWRCQFLDSSEFVADRVVGCLPKTFSALKAKQVAAQLCNFSRQLLRHEPRPLLVQNRARPLTALVCFTAGHGNGRQVLPQARDGRHWLGHLVKLGTSAA